MGHYLSFFAFADFYPLHASRGIIIMMMITDTKRIVLIHFMSVEPFQSNISALTVVL